MIFEVTHKTSYSYADTVALCQNLLRLHPRDHAWQKCVRHELSITPAPSSQYHQVDFFGNHVTWISLEEHHSKFHICATSEVHVDPRPPADVAASLPWEQARDLLRTSADPTHIEATQYVFGSRHVVTSDDLADYARTAFQPGRPMLEAAMELTEQIHNDFTFMPGSTDLGTSAMEVLRTRRGVCQDFAHLQLGCLRSLGLAGRYVSGYLVTRPPPGRPRLVGADVSHAWISVFEPHLGWVDFDPTNGVMPSDQHITIAWARDYDEIAPVRGITVGGASQWLGVAVDVVPVDEKRVDGG